MTSEKIPVLRSHVLGKWHAADSGFVSLYNPSTEEEIARASSQGIDFAATVRYGRERGGPALRAMTFGERGVLLKELSKALRTHREELLDLSARNNGTTHGGGAFDIDGASGTLAYYAALGRRLGDRTFLADGDGVQLSRSEAFWGQHVLLPRHGVAVAINAFNFPTWGFAEKLACALLAGMPMIVKPATATSLVAHRAAEILIESGALPKGAFQLIVGSAGDLLDHLGAQDVLAFTGSADTALLLRGKQTLLACSTAVNVEADSLNAAVVAPGVEPGSSTLELFYRDVLREMTQKAGQKCTAVRRILVPRKLADEIQTALSERLGAVITGNPVAGEVTMGPLATRAQLLDAEEGVRELEEAGAQVVSGTGKRVAGVGSPAGKGFFFGPTLLRHDDPAEAGAVHQREVFGPVATLLPYDGKAETAATLVAQGGGTLVTSVYADDAEWLGSFLALAGSSTGRLYVGSEGSAPEAPGSGMAMPQTLHGGPGRAGGGEELGGLVGVKLYMQRVALQGSRETVDALAGLESAEQG